MVPGIDPKVDYAFKKLLGSESSADLLVSFLNAVLDPPPHQTIQQAEILNPFQPQESEDDKLSILDIKARDETGRLFNIEMQLVPAYFLPERILYYWARLFQDQLFAGDDYSELRPTISVCISSLPMFPQSEHAHSKFRLLEERSAFPFTDRIELHTLELEKFRNGEAAIASDLERWMYFLKHAAGFDQAKLPQSLDRPVFHRAMEVLTMIQQNRAEHELYEARLKFQLDENTKRKMMETGIQQALERGLKEGLEQGLEQGLQQGITTGAVIERIRIFEELLGKAVSPAEVLSELTLDQLNERAAMLKSEWTDRNARN
ncbi:PD-(D/E)XK nuclease family transposase [Anatilimnocola aggregata]|uniref:PD-(D/E)XK nuclease family transposase n=1 Tax=Anatilimnocola aggregata TaxID=2528021 RepID=A0A517YD24_9BACT|nr:Rpn family recombination-promoting nuclease/putative transposase [Anatilimnocola aggregata]QDU28145.1 PD-(D/E)XK nuclease family transposase [Anatilimnocola aggregata]